MVLSSNCSNERNEGNLYLLLYGLAFHFPISSYTLLYRRNSLSPHSSGLSFKLWQTEFRASVSNFISSPVNQSSQALDWRGALKLMHNEQAGANLKFSTPLSVTGSLVELGRFSQLSFDLNSFSLSSHCIQVRTSASHASLGGTPEEDALGKKEKRILSSVPQHIQILPVFSGSLRSFQHISPLQLWPFHGLEQKEIFF